jgi:serine/threonine-protein kinase 24/25/MST4
MSIKEEKDEWIFDTIKAQTLAPALKHTQKRRKLSVVEHSTPEEALQQLDINGSPHQPKAPINPAVQKNNERRRSSAKVASPARRPSGQKQPLVPDMSFGNSGSTIRQFRRVSDNSPNISPESSVAGRDENRPPLAETITKESLLGRRVYSSVIENTFQEVHSQTSSHVKREAISRVADAWSALDAADPEGEYQLLKLIIEKVHRLVSCENFYTAWVFNVGIVIPSSHRSSSRQTRAPLKSRNWCLQLTTRISGATGGANHCKFLKRTLGLRTTR